MPKTLSVLMHFSITDEALNSLAIVEYEIAENLRRIMKETSSLSPLHENKEIYWHLGDSATIFLVCLTCGKEDTDISISSNNNICRVCGGKTFKKFGSVV